VNTCTRLEQAVHGAWMVIEAVPEKLELKRKVFSELDRVTDADTVLASNSSSLPSSQLITHVAHPERVLNTHYYQPTQLNMVELMSCGKTDQRIIDTLLQILPVYGLVPFHVRRESDGFIFNRIWAAIKRECLMVVEAGVAEPQERSTKCGGSLCGPVAHLLRPWTMSVSTSCLPSRNTTRRSAPAYPPARESSYGTRSIGGGSAPRPGAASTTMRLRPNRISSRRNRAPALACNAAGAGAAPRDVKQG
jgi:3-hydroxyacyl-CoA dehydrogenase, NAD binding domain